jgi:tryptophanyl-tRNA synthetase
MTHTTTILTGARANNDLHIGNYLGALKPMVDMANTTADKYTVQLFVPDLHSFTTEVDHETLYAMTMRNVKTYIALGFPVDHPNVYVYRQSFISAHSELAWILDCFTSFGELQRMTQFKDRSAKIGEKRISVGLFNYPVLMAADILLYGAKYVPVGDDQSQHLEFARDVAIRMNNKFGNLFTVPASVSEQHKFFGNKQGLRVRDLVDPSKKMSKSDATGKGVVFLNESTVSARKKIKSATTDSYSVVSHDYTKQPGISSLLDVADGFGGDSKEYIATHNYGALKQAVADKVAGFLADYQAKLASIDDRRVEDLLLSGEHAMQLRANETLDRVQRAVGLRAR